MGISESEVIYRILLSIFLQLLSGASRKSLLLLLLRCWRQWRCVCRQNVAAGYCSDCQVLPSRSMVEATSALFCSPRRLRFHALCRLRQQSIAWSVQ